MTCYQQKIMITFVDIKGFITLINKSTGPTTNTTKITLKNNRNSRRLKMKFKCNQQILSKALNTVSKAVTSRTTIPILKGILLRATNDGKLYLSASDLDLSIETVIDVDVEDEGSIVVLSKLFGDIIRKLPNEELLIEEQENKNILIKSSKSEFTIVGISSEEFPSLGEVDKEANSLVLNKEMFKEMIKKTAFSASIDESKGVIVGTLIEIKDNLINMVALDGFRMAISREKINIEEERKIIIAAKILSEVNKIISETDGEEEISILLNNKKAIIFIENTKIVIRLLEGEFIKYRDIIPKEHKSRIIANRADLLSGIERASLLAKEGKNNLIKLQMNETEMIITSRSEEGNVREEVMITREGNALEIGFNSKYLLDVLKVIEDDEISMEFNSNINPCLVKPIEGNSYEYLILPVRITSNN